MKRSNQVPASMIIALAAGISVAGCGGTRTYRECVDASGRVVNDASCRSGIGGAHWISRTVQSGGFGGTGSGGFFGG